MLRSDEEQNILAIVEAFQRVSRTVTSVQAFTVPLLEEHDMRPLPLATHVASAITQLLTIGVLCLHYSLSGFGKHCSIVQV
jgi:hypothetical protein